MKFIPTSVPLWAPPRQEKDRLRKRGPSSSTSDLVGLLQPQFDRTSPSTVSRRIRFVGNRLLQSPRVQKTLRFIRRNIYILLPLTVLLIIQIIFNPLDGNRVDRFLTRRVMARTLKRQQNDLRARDIYLPAVQQVGTPNMINTQASLRELLIRRTRRREALEALATDGRKCEEAVCTVPKVLFAPSDMPWPSTFRPGTDNMHSFDETERRQLVKEMCPQSYSVYNNISTALQTDLWSFCTLFHYGGYVGEDPHDSWLDSAGANEDAAVARVAIASEGMRPTFVATPPRHPLFACVLSRAQQMVEQSMWKELIEEIPSTEGAGWVVLDGQVCGADKPVSCCEYVRHNTDESALSGNWHLYIRFDPIKKESLIKPATVEVMEPPHEPALRAPKKPIGLVLRQRRAEPSWLCNRCLHFAERGTFRTCKSVCPADFGDIICRKEDEAKKETVDVTILIRGHPSPIPRIIHQTWFEDVTLDRYPHLARLQNSWRNSGWEYRFYNDDSARQYIIDNYPPRFIAAFDSLVHGAYKADLFRYLVLLKEGGVYADIDMMLETTLDSFITPTMTFFAARDIPCEYAGEPFCLWNGFLGSTPGHPFMVNAVERLLNLVDNRSDLHDIERAICNRLAQSPESHQTWKVHAQPLLLLSGPCGLGIAMNEALNRPALEAIDIGWTSLKEMEVGGKRDLGDALILVGDKFDLGAFRISDSERSFVVASTDFQSISGPLDLRLSERDPPANRPPHYSASKRGIAVWGSANVYTDDSVSTEQVTFKVRHEKDVNA